MKSYIIIYTVLCFIVTSILGPGLGYAQGFVLPAPGQMLALSPSFSPAVLKGIKLDPKNPFRFHFFVDQGDSRLSQEGLKQESSKLIKYFLASLTIPEKDLWVNLSPYEKDRIVPQEFGQTEMGRDLLAEDYILKQITASVIYPESQLGKEFWNKVYAQAQAKYGTTNIPINTFNKVWIVPDKAVVYENGGVAFVLENHLKVMLEEDYLSMTKHQKQSMGRQPGDMTLVVSPSRLPSNESLNTKAPQGHNQPQNNTINALGSQIIREIVIPALTKEVNEGKNFSQLRQVFYSLILATWYKTKIKNSILNKVYSNQNKIGGVNVSLKDKDKIYQDYLRAFKKGVFNYIQDSGTPNNVSDATQGQYVTRKYFSGGVDALKGGKDDRNHFKNDLRSLKEIQKNDPIPALKRIYPFTFMPHINWLNKALDIFEEGVERPKQAIYFEAHQILDYLCLHQDIIYKQGESFQHLLDNADGYLSRDPVIWTAVLKSIASYPGLKLEMKSSAQLSRTGGIDLNPAQMSLQVRKGSPTEAFGDDKAFKFDFNGAEIDAAQVTGATFTIRSMTPVTNLPEVLGLRDVLAKV